MASSKMDMSLDQIIKLQNKEKKSTTTRSQTVGVAVARGRRGGRGGRGARRGGGVLKVGVVRTGLRNRRLGVVGAAVVKGGGVRQQRLAQNLVKRAMLQRRRQAISQRNAANVASASGGQPNTQRLLQEMRRWRQKAQVLQSALQQQRVAVSPKKVRLRRNGNNFQQTVQQPNNSLQSRLGWRGRRGGRGVVNQRLAVRKTVQQRNSGTFGQMHMDILSREQARQQRLENEIMNQTLQTVGVDRMRGRGRPRGRRQILPETNVQLAHNNINRRFGGQSLARSPLRQVGGIVTSNFNARRGRGRPAHGLGRQQAVRESLNSFRSSFVSSNQSGTTLNERFGGGGAGVGVGVNVFGRGRGGRRGRGNRRYNY